MKKVWKMGVLMGMMTLFFGMTFAQSYQVDTARLERAHERLVELKAVDKSELSKWEKKAWREEKRHQKRIIAAEMNKARFVQQMERQWNYGSPFFNGYYNPAFGIGNFHPIYGGFYARPIIIRPQRCVVPSQPRISRSDAPRS